MLLALAWPSHIYHTMAQTWFLKNAKSGWATCPLTQCGFIRISSNPSFSKDAVTPHEALHILHRNISSPNHIFWPDDISFDIQPPVVSLLSSHRQVTDAYLLSLAVNKGGKLVTLDRKITVLLTSDSPHSEALEVITHDSN